MPPQQNFPQQMPQQQPQMQPGLSSNGQAPGIFAAPPPNNTQPPKKASKLPIIIIVILSIFTLGLAALSVMLYGQMTDYRDNYTAKSAIDIEQAKAEQKLALDAEYAEKEKAPNREYITPNSAASVKIVYPKTWDLYTQEDTQHGTVSNYFNINAVPQITNKDNSYSLRLEVLSKNYADVTKTFDGSVKNGKVTVSPFVAKNVANAETGVRVDGEIRSGITGSMVILPVRDKTIQIWTEGGKFTQDFDKIVLENLTYNP